MDPRRNGVIAVTAVTWRGAANPVNQFRDGSDSNDSGWSDLESRLPEAAIELARHGLSVFPLIPGTKVPRKGSVGFHDATSDTDQIREWWNTDRKPNIGVRTLGLAVVDLDLYHPQSGASWDQLLELLGTEPLPDTWVSRTGRGGNHYWYQLDDSENRHLKNGYSSKLPINSKIVRLPHIDLKCSGGSYVVAPPSRVPTGNYVWLRRDTLTTAPDWLRGPALQTAPQTGIRRKIRVKGSARRVAAIFETVATAPVGQRNDTLNWGAFRIAEVVMAGVLQQRLAHDALLEAAIDAGLRSEEAERTILSAFSAWGI